MKQYIVDAFTDRVFSGNPAAVCILADWPEDELMQHIAMENNLSETAFAVPEGEDYRLRWFTPGGEIDLCGHATLATAYVILNHIQPERERVTFRTLSGPLTVVRQGALYQMDFPAYTLRRVEVTPQMTRALGATPAEAWMGRDLLCVFDDEQTVRDLAPDLDQVRELDGLLLQVTGPGKTVDCVSRSFAPKLALGEDPVCGSGHCHIIPYWAGRKGQTRMTAYQASPRGGTLYGQLAGDRVLLSGAAALYAVADLYV